MGFYNKATVQPVSSWVDPVGGAVVLPVAGRGGLAQARASVPASGSALLLPVPPAGSMYRLQRLISNGPAIILQGTTSGFLYSNGGLAAPDNLDGLLAQEGLTAFNQSASGAVEAYLAYDNVVNPQQIQ